ncbi:Mas-related G-protein coupled receptor member H, partial [Ophiophagus hannah]
MQLTPCEMRAMRELANYKGLRNSTSVNLIKKTEGISIPHGWLQIPLMVCVDNLTEHQATYINGLFLFTAISIDRNFNSRRRELGTLKKNLVGFQPGTSILKEEIMEHYERLLRNLSLTNRNAIKEPNITIYFNENQTKSIVLPVMFIFCCAGLPLNGRVIWLLGFQMKRNPFTMLILNLAITDLGVLIFMPILSIRYFE